MKLHDAGELLAAESARYAAMGWMRGTSGNLSVVLGNDPLRLAVTASGLDKGMLEPSDVVEVDFHGDAVSGQELSPSAEAGLHARVARSGMPSSLCRMPSEPHSSRLRSASIG